MNNKLMLPMMYKPRLSMAPREASRYETILIALALFSLPLFEAPKNIASFAFLLLFVWNSFRMGNLGRGTPFDIPVVGLVTVLWVAPIFSEFSDLITPLSSAPRWTLLGLFVLTAGRLDFSSGQIKLFAAALLLGGAFAVIESLWVWHQKGNWDLIENMHPEFRSVGHVNHSAMYAIVPLAIGVGAAFSREAVLRLLSLVAILTSLLFLLYARSLVGIVSAAALISSGCLIFGVSRLSFKNTLAVVLVGLAVLFSAISTPVAKDTREEFFGRVSGDDIFASRDRIFNSAIAVWDRHPVVGSGWFSFGLATSEAAVRSALDGRGEQYDSDDYLHVPHGHNLWITMLIERGIFGVVAVTFLLFLYVKTFVHLAVSRAPDPGCQWVAVSALLVAVGFIVAGLGNTTMMNEHGQAGMTFISVAYGYLRGARLVGAYT